MLSQLLQTKFFVPQIRAGYVSRPRLLKLLDESLGCKLTLVSAPAGFGKTTMLASWARESTRAVAWLTLDEGDSDPVRFLAYLVAAIQRVDEKIAEGLLDEYKLPRFFDPDLLPPLEEIQTALVNQLSRARKDLTLILDDYHLVAAEPVHNQVGFLLDHLPPQLHLVISTRADPPIPLARLRGRGELSELRLVELRFTEEEAVEFLRQAVGQLLSSDDMHALTAKTEGWIAGLQMAAISLQGHENVQAFLRGFTGSNRYILDYLVEEVFQRQPGSTQDFLLKTSILDRMCASLCDALLTDPSPPSPIDSQITLESLEQANLFIISLDENREWYRYHQLFSDLLRKQLGQAQPGLLPLLHSRASAWYEANQLVSEAIDHALAARNYERAAALIEQLVEGMMMRGETASLLSWLNRLPDDIVEGSPDLGLYKVAALAISGQPRDLIDSSLERLEYNHPTLLAETTILRAYLGLISAHFERADRLSRQGLSELTGKYPLFRSIGEWVQAIILTTVDDIQRREQILESLVRKNRDLDNPLIAVADMCQLAEAYIHAGQLHRAKDLYGQALSVARQLDGRILPVAGQALIGLGQLHMEWNELEEAEQFLNEGIQLAEQWRMFGALEGYLVLAFFNHIQGNDERAGQMIVEAQRLAEAFDLTEIDDRIVAFSEAQLKIRQGKLDEALRYFQEIDKPGIISDLDRIDSHEPQPFDDRMFKYEQILLAQLLMAEGKPQDVLAILNPLLPRLEESHRTRLVIQTEILRALALQANGNLREADHAFERALTEAEPSSFVRLFIDEGEPVGDLLHRAITAGICVTYARKLAFALEGERAPRGSRSVQEQAGLVEPLSERELEVLGLLSSSLTVPEIAQDLYIAESTVRSHVKSVYAKLGVHRRMEAVQRAEELGLLSS